MMTGIDGACWHVRAIYIFCFLVANCGVWDGVRGLDGQFFWLLQSHPDHGFNNRANGSPALFFRLLFLFLL